MENLQITCTRCEMPVGHVCNPDIKTLLLKIFTFKPEGAYSEAFIEALKESPYYREGDENHPFFSEGFLYNLLGKDNARTVRAYLHSLMAAMGFARHGLYEDLVKLEKAQDLLDENQRKLYDLATQIRKTDDQEEKERLKGRRVALMDKMQAAHKVVDRLDRWEMPEEKVRFTFLSAVSRIAGDDKLMYALKDIDPEVLEARLHTFLKAQVED